MSLAIRFNYVSCRLGRPHALKSRASDTTLEVFKLWQRCLNRYDVDAIGEQSSGHLRLNKRRLKQSEATASKHNFSDNARNHRTDIHNYLVL